MWVGLTVAWLLLIHRTAEMKEAAHTGHWAELLQTVRQRVEWRWVGRVSRASDCAEQGVYCLDFVDSPSDSVVRGHEPCGGEVAGCSIVSKCGACVVCSFVRKEGALSGGPRSTAHKLTQTDDVLGWSSDHACRQHYRHDPDRCWPHRKGAQPRRRLLGDLGRSRDF
jgi:hypothetical protein